MTWKRFWWSLAALIALFWIMADPAAAGGIVQQLIDKLRCFAVSFGSFLSNVSSG